jgi:hypothetical protein
MKYELRLVVSSDEWKAYHAIRKRVLWEARGDFGSGSAEILDDLCLSKNHRRGWSLAYALRWSFASNESPRAIKRIKYPWTSNRFATSMR